MKKRAISIICLQLLSTYCLLFAGGTFGYDLEKGINTGSSNFFQSFSTYQTYDYIGSGAVGAIWIKYIGYLLLFAIAVSCVVCVFEIANNTNSKLSTKIKRIIISLPSVICLIMILLGKLCPITPYSAHDNPLLNRSGDYLEIYGIGYLGIIMLIAAAVIAFLPKNISMENNQLSVVENEGKEKAVKQKRTEKQEANTSSNNSIEQMSVLKELKEKDLITQEEYELKKKEIIDKL